MRSNSYGVCIVTYSRPITVAARSKAKICGRLVAGVAGSNSTKPWMFVCCVYMLCCPV
jgi:hypothetical protein